MITVYTDVSPDRHADLAATLARSFPVGYRFAVKPRVHGMAVPDSPHLADDERRILPQVRAEVRRWLSPPLVLVRFDPAEYPVEYGGQLVGVLRHDGFHLTAVDWQASPEDLRELADAIERKQDELSC